MAEWNVINSAELAGNWRLDSEYWREVYIENIEAVRRARQGGFETTLLRKVVKKVTGSAFYPSFVGYYSNDGMPFLRVADLGDLFLKQENLVKISPSIIQAHHQVSTITPGDLVIAKGGSIGGVCIVTDDFGESAVCRDVIAVQTDFELLDPYYLSVFLNTKLGQLQLERNKSQQVQAHLTFPAVAKLEIAYPSPEIQMEIREIAMLAYNAATDAKSFYTQAQHLLESSLGLDKLNFQKPVGYTARFSELEQSRRLDPEHFYPAFQNLIANLPDHINLVPLGTQLSFCQRGKQPVYSKHGLPVVNSNYLNSQAGQLQVEMNQRGSSGQLELYSFDIRKFFVWVAPDSLQKEIRRLYDQAAASEQRSGELLAQAKARVEQLIEGNRSHSLAADRLLQGFNRGQIAPKCVFPTDYALKPEKGCWLSGGKVNNYHRGGGAVMSNDLANIENPNSGKGQFLIYEAEDGRVKIDVRLSDETVWLTQQLMADLFRTTKQNIGQHLKNIFSEGELFEDSVVKEFFTTAADGKKYKTNFYNLDAIISVGYRVKSYVATRFRIWATQHLREYIVKGFVLDDERLKNPDQPFDYFDELIRRIQDIRTSERRFYQKITDIYATSIDYDPTLEISIEFFKTVQNKMHWAITGMTAAEIICERADGGKTNMGLTSWRGAKVRKQDVNIAKNYLTEKELLALNNLVEQRSFSHAIPRDSPLRRSSSVPSFTASR